MKALIWTLSVLLFLLTGPGRCRGAQFKTKKIIQRRSPRATDGKEDVKKCAYTFLVPEQKITGPICVNTKGQDAGAIKDMITRMDLENLKDVLSKQKREIDVLQLVVDVDGNLVNEVKLLRKESRNMNSRVTQLYMQLLHEIIRKRDNALELSQLENRILNQTADMLQLASKYKDLEHKYQHLATLARNQSEVIAQLEEHCQRVPEARPAPPPPPAAPPQVYQPAPYNRITNQISTNEIQSDQNPKALPPPPPTLLHTPPHGHANRSAEGLSETKWDRIAPRP